MNAVEKYKEAVTQFKAKNFDAALKVLEEVKAAAPARTKQSS